MISYRKSDIIDRLTEHQDSYISDVVQDIFKYWASYASSQGPAEDPRWDHTQCRCENNGDYCEYCEEIARSQDENVGTMSRLIIWQELNKKVIAGSFLDYLRRRDSVVYQKVVDAIDNPTLKPLLETLIADTPIETKASYRHADIRDKVSKPVEIRWEFKAHHGDTYFPGGSIADMDHDFVGNIIEMMRAMEGFVASLPGYVDSGQFALIEHSDPFRIAIQAAEFVEKQQGYVSHETRQQIETGDCKLLVMVKP